MFGLSKREQRWAAEERAMEIILGTIVDLVRTPGNKLYAAPQSERIAELEAKVREKEEIIGALNTELAAANKNAARYARRLS